MFPSLIIIVVAVALTSSSSTTMVRAQCPCYPLVDTPNFIICDDPSLTSIPDCVANNITILSIKTPSIPLVADSIRRFTNLRDLIIAEFDNPQISKTFLSGQPNITTFQITSTSLDYVDKDWFLFAPRIKNFYLFNNSISSLASDTFSYLPTLEFLGLNLNQLTSLPASLLQGTAMKYIVASGNPWHCYCELATFVQWTRDHGVTIAGPATCLQPPELEGLSLKDLTLDLACKK